MALKFSDILKGAGKFVTTPGRDLAEMVKLVQLASGVKRVKPEDYKSMAEYNKALKASQTAHKALAQEQITPTANKTLNQILGVTPQEQQRQVASELLTPRTAVKNALIGGSMVVPGASSLLGSIGTGALGAAMGAGGYAPKGEEVTSALKAAPLGGALGAAGYGLGKLGTSMTARLKSAKPASDSFTRSLNLSKSDIKNLGGWTEAKKFATELADDAKTYGIDISNRYSKAEALPQIKSILSEDVNTALSSSTKSINANDILANLSNNQTMKYLMTKDPDTVNYILQLVSDNADEAGNISAVSLKGIIDNIQDIAGGFKNVTGDQATISKQIFSTTRDELRNQLGIAAPEASDLLGKWSKYIKVGPSIESGAVTATKEIGTPLIGKIGGTATTKASDVLTDLLSPKGTQASVQQPSSFIQNLLTGVGQATSPIAGVMGGISSMPQQPAQTQQATPTTLGEDDPGMMAIRSAFGGGATQGGMTPDNILTNQLVSQGKLPASQAEIYPQGQGMGQSNQVRQILAMGVLNGDISGSDASTIMELLGLSTGTATTGTKLPAGALTELSNTQEALNLLPQLSGLITEGGSAFGPLEGPIRSMIPWDKTGQKAKSTITLIKQIIGKGLEGGVLRKEDEYKYENILPKLGDTESTVRTKIELLQQTLNNKYNTLVGTYEAGGYNPYYGQ